MLLALKFGRQCTRAAGDQRPNLYWPCVWGRMHCWTFMPPVRPEPMPLKSSDIGMLAEEVLTSRTVWPEPVAVRLPAAAVRLGSLRIRPVTP